MNNLAVTFSADHILQQALSKRKAEGAFRYLQYSIGKNDFCSNDYLGLSRIAELQKRIEQSTKGLSIGSVGSRLLAGNTESAIQLENELATFHRGEAGLLYNSGYDANVGFFQCVADRHCTILFDELIHASVRDGIRMSTAKSWSFRHNDIDHLKTMVKRSTGTVFVAVESLYSMDGDIAPLAELADYCAEMKLNLVVDEAHSNGIYGSSGEGLCVELGIENQTFARLYTFGKAIGTHGAIWVGSHLLRDYLINFSRAFTYTTSLPPHALVCIRECYHYLKEHTYLLQQLHERITFFRTEAAKYSSLQLLPSSSPIQGLIVPGNQAAIAKADYLQKQGFDLRPILAPTVPVGTERLRISLHTYNTDEEIQRLLALVAN
jgi:8-amino-7-oxononanoate synthase